MVRSADCIIIGGGHNGLTAAAYLAKTGKKVTVLEARDIVGGFCTTEELVSEAPGFRFNPTSLDHVLLKVEPSVVTDLKLHEYGLGYLEIDPFYSYLRPDGFSLCFWRDYRKTVDEIATFSRRDAETYARLTECLVRFWHVGFPYMMGHPSKVRLKTLAQLGVRAFAARKELPEAVRIMMMSPQEAIFTYFESDEMRTAMAAFAASNMFPMDFPGTGIIFAVMALQHGWGVYRAHGGGGEFPKALRKLVEAQGGEVRTSTIVEEILLEHGCAKGVRLAGGEVIHAPRVIAAVPPQNLFRELLPESSLPEDSIREAATFEATNVNISSAAGGVALGELPELPVSRDRAQDIYRGGIIAGESYEQVARWIEACKAGQMGEGQLPAWYIVPSFLDRTLVPEGSSGETVYAYIPAVPKQWSDGSSWDSHRTELCAASQASAGMYMKNFADLQIGEFMVTPEDLPNFSHNNPQHPFHVDMTLSRMGPNRPTPSLSGYTTPAKGVYHAGAGCAPNGYGQRLEWAQCGEAGVEEQVTLLIELDNRRWLYAEYSRSKMGSLVWPDLCSNVLCWSDPAEISSTATGYAHWGTVFRPGDL